jgi:hypothetical protein
MDILYNRLMKNELTGIGLSKHHQDNYPEVRNCKII